VWVLYTSPSGRRRIRCDPPCASVSSCLPPKTAWEGEGSPCSQST
jgi:hypothetical protein